MKIINFNELDKANFYIDALYKGGSSGNMSDEVISKLMQVANQGGFRYKGESDQPAYIILYSSMEDKDWPDTLDTETGSFVYYGDNKSPGKELHDTPKKGNIILKNIFSCFHSGIRTKIPPIFIFTKSGPNRDVIFRGLAVPGYPGFSQTEDLVGIWKSYKGNRFQNYKAIFSILDEGFIDRNWIEDLQNSKSIESRYCPKSFKNWVINNSTNLLRANRTRKFRTKEEQLPLDQELKLLESIITYFHNQNRKGFEDFEKFSAELLLLFDKNFTTYDLTRPSRDGGRDAIGQYKLGLESNSIYVDYALEAKCYSLNTSVGVKETSRLISRLLHRQFGVFVTTSYVSQQAYEEIRDKDNHPVIIISGIDIITILIKAGYATEEAIIKWIESLFK